MTWLQLQLGPAKLVETEQLDSDMLTAEPGIMYSQKHGAKRKLEAADVLLTPTAPDQPALTLCTRTQCALQMWQLS